MRSANSQTYVQVAKAVAELLGRWMDPTRASRMTFLVGAGASTWPSTRVSSIVDYGSYGRQIRPLGWQPEGPASQIVRLRQASEALKRAQRTRVDRILLDWEEESRDASLLIGPFPRYRRGRPLLCRKLPAEHHDFEAFLGDAHRHKAVARQSTLASRRWFEDWRRQALVAVSLGLSPRELLALLRSAAVAKATRTATKRPSPHAEADSARFRERLENVIFPNAPGAAGSLRHLAPGGGLATAQI